MDFFLNKIEKLVIFFIIYTLTFLIFSLTLKYTLPFILAFLFTLFLKYPTQFLIKKLKFKSWIASLLVTISFFSIITLLTTILIVSLGAEIGNLYDYLQNILSKNTSSMYNYLSKIESWLNNLNLNINPDFWVNIELYLHNLSKTLLSNIINLSSSILQYLFKFLGYIPYVGMTIVCTLLSTYFFTKNISSNKNILDKLLPGKVSPQIKNAFTHAKKMLFNYCLSYLFLISVTMIITFIGFLFFKIKYALVLSILAGLFDLLPILGTIMIYLPLIFYYFHKGNYFLVISLIALYALVTIIRQILEPKVVSSSLGINPVFSLAALFIGLQLNGFIGVIFCMFLIICYTVLKKVDLI
ncbi:sporulation integral membrane protein YtvI [Clostridium tarantellae]|uniref:Sporulation integral membrane protein YtvI n=1 Tax=Clostridium tarantellae TaxID=39493 RepID=A0A6I1MM06_9CLOT|nr:sporulation integral membrane protein YtvI [Clostridium tarantellae]MPQ43773.1 sporulation integral membrane protein YtvI [Clostridium tarantellae]